MKIRPRPMFGCQFTRGFSPKINELATLPGVKVREILKMLAKKVIWKCDKGFQLILGQFSGVNIQKEWVKMSNE